MEIIIDTSGHCIETASKKEYERLIQQYFKSDPAEKSILEQQIEALAYFLEYADFPGLRNQYHAMGPSGKTSVLVIPQTLKHMHILLDRKTVYPAWKKT